MLVISCEDTVINVGSIGEIFLTKGYYTYLGSSNIQKPYLRVLRHLMRGAKKIRWHIDSLTMVCKPIAGLVCIGAGEDLLYRTFSSWEHVTPSVKGFGCSDCRSHLTHLFNVRGFAGENVYEVVKLVMQKTLSLCSGIELVT